MRAASCEISVLMSRNWLALVGSQCWGRDAHGCNYSTSISLEAVGMLFPFPVRVDNKTIALLSDAQKTKSHCRKFHHACVSMVN